MKEQLINFETAKLAKEKGFDIPVYYGYNENGTQSNEYIWNYSCEGGMSLDEWLYDFNKEEYMGYLYSAPTQSLLQKWLREEHDILVYVDPKSHHYFQYHIITDYYEIISSERSYNWGGILEKGLQKALKLI